MKQNLKKVWRLCLLSQEWWSSLGQEREGNVGYSRLRSVCARDEGKPCAKTHRPHMDITNLLGCWVGLGSLETNCPMREAELSLTCPASPGSSSLDPIMKWVKVPRIRRRYCLTILEARVWNQGVGTTGSFYELSGEDLSQASLPWLVDGRLLPLSLHLLFSVCVSVSKFPALIRTPILSDQGLTLIQYGLILTNYIC